MNSLVDYTREGAVGVITVNNPPVNALSSGVPPGIRDGLQRGIADPQIEAFVILGAGSTFIAGADIRELEQLMDPDCFTLRNLFPLLEECPKPVIAAMHGTALGGGLETALGCHFRCALPTARFGLPEVRLGLLPGAGGTQRLPRLIGVEPALDLMLNGRHVDAEQALSLGLVDEILSGELLPSALDFARTVIAEKRPLRVISRITPAPDTARDDAYFTGVRESLKQNLPGRLAPLLIVDCVEAAVNRSFGAGWALEDELFRRCVASPQSKELIEQFFAERRKRKNID